MNIKKYQKNVFIVLVILFVSKMTLAATVGGSVSMATGGTGRGTVEPTDGTLLNPAIVAQIPTKYMSFNYTKDHTQVAISDNGRDALFPAALSFVRNEKDN